MIAGFLAAYQAGPAPVRHQIGDADLSLVAFPSEAAPFPVPGNSDGMPYPSTDAAEPQGLRCCTEPLADGRQAAHQRVGHAELVADVDQAPDGRVAGPAPEDPHLVDPTGAQGCEQALEFAVALVLCAAVAEQAGLGEVAADLGKDAAEHRDPGR